MRNSKHATTFSPASRNADANTERGKAILVGGGAKNLGGLISRTFAGDGTRICVHYNSNSTKKDADKTVADIKVGGRRGVRRSR